MKLKGFCFECNKNVQLKSEIKTVRGVNKLVVMCKNGHEVNNIKIEGIKVGQEKMFCKQCNKEEPVKTNGLQAGFKCFEIKRCENCGCVISKKEMEN